MLNTMRKPVRQNEAFRDDVLVGLSRPQKSLPSRWLYDDAGSELFEDITRLDEYYLTRTETAILLEHSREIAEFCGDHATLLEFGAGAGIKTEILLNALHAPRLYVPIDIAGDFLQQTVARFDRTFPNLPVKTIVSDFTADFVLPASIPERHRVAFFPGSTIGNLNGSEVVVFLKRLRRHVGVGGRAIIGVDMKKDLGILLPAYDDHERVTAAFNLNLLKRVNRELDGNFELDRFEHRASWNEAQSAVEMHLVSIKSQTVTISGQRFTFAAGETIHTESSRKYDVQGFIKLANSSGWRTARHWTDELGMFSVFGLD